MARQELVNLESYLAHRTKLNEMMEEVYHLPSNARVINCDASYNPPAGTDADGSAASPFRLIQDAIDALNPGSSGNIMLTPATYSTNFTLERNMSLINLYGRGDVVLNPGSGIVVSDTVAQFQRINFQGQSAVAQIIGDANTPTVENVLIKECHYIINNVFRGGTTGEDTFSFFHCTFNATISTRSSSFYGSTHLLESCSWTGLYNLALGSRTTSGQIGTLVKMVDCIIDVPVESRSENNKTTQIIIFNTQFNFPMTFDVGTGGSIILDIDTVTYGYLLDAGTNFDVTGLTLRVRGLAEYEFNSTIITATITNAQLEDVCTLDIPDLQAGQYEFVVSFAYVTADINDSLVWSFTDDMSFLPSFIHESSDSENHDTLNLTRPIAHTGGAFTTTLQMIMDEDGSDATVDLVMISMKQVG